MAESPARKLVDQYRAEFGEKYNELRKYVSDFNENMQQHLQQFNATLESAQPKMAQQGDEVVGGLQNMTAMPAGVYEKLLQMFAWTGVMQAGIFVAAIISGYILYPFIGLTLGSFWSFMLAFVLLPTLAYVHLNNSGDDDRTTRFKLLAFALVEGLLTGYLYSQRYLSSMQPMIFITPFTVAAISQQVPSFLAEGASRINALSAFLGSGFVLHLAIGLPLGQLSFPYLLLSLLYTAVAFCAIQLYIKYSAENPPVNLDHFCMLGYVCATLLCQGFVFFVFGGAKQLEE